MDDLAGLDWSKDTSTKKSVNPSYIYDPSAFSALKPTPPASGRATPLNHTSQPPSKPVTPANDSFSNLVPFSNSNSTANLPLQEQQRRLADLRSQQQKKQRQGSKEQHLGGDGSFWDNLGSGRSTPAVDSQRDVVPPSDSLVEEEEDIFAAFNTSTAKQQPPPVQAQTPAEDDDPFELSKLNGRRAKPHQSQDGSNNDDLLGSLGNPAAAAKHKPEPVQQPPPRQSKDADPRDRAVAELVDMGFSAEKSQQALQATGAGADVQAAVGWLLNQAHQEARDRSLGRDVNMNGHSPVGHRRSNSRTQADQQQRQDQQADDPDLSRSRQQSSSASFDKDPAQLAAELGNNFLKTANSFWRQSTKKVQQAVQEFNSDSEASQPKWMRDPDRMAKAEARPQQRGEESGTARRRRRSSAAQAKEQQLVTDEVLMLESQRPTPPPRPVQRSRAEARLDSSADNSRDHSPALPSRLREAHSPQPAFVRQPQSPRPAPQQRIPSSRAALNRQAVEEQAAQAYVSSARRRKPPAQAPEAVSELDLLEGSMKAPPPQPASSNPAQPIPSPKPTSLTVRPSAPKRTIPSVSALSLKASHSHREKGNEHYKRGDFSSAHQAYSTSLSHLPTSHLPTSHPITIVLLTNRALTALKIGEPKQAITDSDTAISVIGISKGEAEHIDISNGEPPKPMRNYYGKALMRKAEALEQMEKWTEAAAVWREAVEGAHGGATSMQGRLRAEKAANPQLSRPKPKAAIARKPPPRPSLLSATADRNSAAVSALRAANAAADRADDEKFALSDSVTARVDAWKNGKQDNLRALLGSLDTVLWEGSGWKKISMADLVLPGRVKVQYMKGIGKVHPDKVSLMV